MNVILKLEVKETRSQINTNDIFKQISKNIFNFFFTRDFPRIRHSLKTYYESNIDFDQKYFPTALQIYKLSPRLSFTLFKTITFEEKNLNSQ